MNNSKRVLVCEFHQESDTFNPIIDGVDRFNAGGAFEGEQVYAAHLNKKKVLCGAVAAIKEAGGEPILTVIMHGNSGGRVADEAMQLFLDRVRYYTETVGDYDAIYVSLHGATCTESCDDACGEILQQVRAMVGDRPLAVSFDMHANVTEKMLKYADFICSYQTYPHVDYYSTGHRAATFCMRKLAGKKDYCAARLIPVLVPPAGYTTLSGAFKELIDRAKEMVENGVLLDFSISPAQPWLDIPTIASSVITIAADPETAKEKADELANGLFAIRDEMWPELVPVDTIIDTAEANTTGKPVILADSADSPRGGAVGDSPAVAMRIWERGSKIKAAMFICNPASVEQAFKMGVGASGVFSVGAGFTPGIPGPFIATGTVLRLYENDGKYPDIGKAARIAFGNMQIVVCENGTSSFTPAYFQDFGIEPTSQDLLVVKANTSFRVPYAPISDLMFVADTPGAGASNLLLFDWKHLPEGLYPIEPNPEFAPSGAFIW